MNADGSGGGHKWPRRPSEPFVQMLVPSVFGATPTLFGSPLAESVEDLEGADIAFLGVPWSTPVSVGRMGSAAGNYPVNGETLFTAFSISKGIVATCVHILADRGKLDYDAPIASYWPEFGVHGKQHATVRDALAHRIGIPHDPPGFDLAGATNWDAVCQAIADLEPLWEPGTKTGYHPLSYGWILGEVIRRIDGRPVAQFLQEDVCQPLAITGMYFGIPPVIERRVATLELAPGLETMGLSLNPFLRDLADTFNRSEVRRAVIPGAGAIVNARSVARHYAMLAEYGELDGVRVLSSQRVALAATPESQPVDPANSLADTPYSPWWVAHGLGYTLGGGPGPRVNRPRAFGYEGLGTIGFADPSDRFAFAFLKNRLDWSSGEMDSATLVAKTVEVVLS